MNLFEESAEKSEAAAILEGTVLPEREENLERAVLEVVFVIRSNALERKLAQLPASDRSALQQITEEKRKREELKKRIS